MSQLFKECELRRFGEGQVERVVRWLDADEAVIGQIIDLGEGDNWEIVSAPDPALPACVVRRFDPEAVMPASG